MDYLSGVLSSIKFPLKFVKIGSASQRDVEKREYVAQYFELEFFKFDRPSDGSFDHLT